jgi:Histidine kinase-, DNA gyrase B-, and HSP90-like ATPase
MMKQGTPTLDPTAAGSEAANRLNGKPVVLTVDPAGTVLSVNPDFEESAGYSRDAVLGKQIEALEDGPDARLFRALKETLHRTHAGASAGTAPADVRNADSDIAVFPAVDSASCITHFIAIRANGAPAGPPRVPGVGGECHERIGRIAGCFAHHFNNLLTPILGHAELIASRRDESDAARIDAEGILRAAEQGAALTRRLLMFSRKMRLQSTALDLNALLEAMEPLLRARVPAEIDLETNFAPLRGTVHADPSKVEGMLADLVANACEAMPAGGRVSIETAWREVRRPQVRRGVTTAAGEYATLTVRDTGVGMDEETRALVFEPFFTTKPGALGLGLSSTYGFVKATGGYIWIDARPGGGTLVTVFLPCSAPAETDTFSG